MNLKYSGLIFVLIVIVDAISGLHSKGTPSGSLTGNVPAVIAGTEKSQAESGTSESIETVKSISSDVILKPDTTTTTTTTSTTSTTTTTTTTPAPTTSTAAPTTPPPAPAPAPDRGTWIIKNNNNMTCIIAQMAMQLNITYPGKDKSQENVILNVPKNASASGNCESSYQALKISWGPGHSLQINFKSNDTAKNFFVSAFDLNINATVLKDANVVNNNSIWHFANRTSEFFTPLQMSYKCNKEQDLKLNGDNITATAVLSLKDTQVEAYMNKTKAEFGAAQDCDTFDTPDIVPIAVGCALTVLVLVVLAAYLIGRRRSQNRGYLSM